MASKSVEKRLAVQRPQSTLAQKVANEIMKMGDRIDGEQCNRIQFMVGEWPNNERENGGLCYMALVGVIASVLAENEAASGVVEGAK